jgi:hypothetical protein
MPTGGKSDSTEMLTKQQHSQCAWLSGDATTDTNSEVTSTGINFQCKACSLSGSKNLRRAPGKHIHETSKNKIHQMNEGQSHSTEETDFSLCKAEFHWAESDLCDSRPFSDMFWYRLPEPIKTSTMALKWMLTEGRHTELKESTADGS